MSSYKTRIQLLQIQDTAGFQRLCYDMLVRDGYPFLKPMGGLGQKDRGRDALGEINGVYFIGAFSVSENWKSKLKSDLLSIKRFGHKCDVVIFVTNQDVSPLDYDEVMEFTRSRYGWDLDLYALDRLATQVDLHPVLKTLHPGLFPFDVPSPNESGKLLIPIETLYYKVLPFNKRSLRGVQAYGGTAAVILTLGFFATTLQYVWYGPGIFSKPLPGIGLLWMIPLILSACVLLSLHASKYKINMYGKYVFSISEEGAIKFAIIQGICPQCGGKVQFYYNRKSKINYWVCNENPEQHFGEFERSSLKYDELVQ